MIILMFHHSCLQLSAFVVARSVPVASLTPPPRSVHIPSCLHRRPAPRQVWCLSDLFISSSDLTALQILLEIWFPFVNVHSLLVRALERQHVYAALLW